MTNTNTHIPKILFVDDEADILSALKRLTRKLDADCLFASDGHEGLKIIDEQNIDVVVSDMKMPKMSGIEFLAEVAKRHPETIRIALTGYADQELIVGSINEGRVWGYLNKPWDNTALLVTLNQALETRHLLLERLLLQRRLSKYQQFDKPSFCGFIGNCEEMQIIYHTIETVAPSNASVFITGASGTGKEVTAQAIHECSKRSNKPFIALNCAAIPNDLLESEIFGHVKGAFSGAVSHREGAASMANGGTLFLDELAEMDIALQSKLLRFIQTKSFQKVGSNKLESVDIRFICATNKNPQKAIANKELREDLFYRLNVISIELPDLKNREWDKVILADHFLTLFAESENKSFSGFTQNAEKLLFHYDWPGNIRQLQNAMQSISILCKGPLVGTDDIAKTLSLKHEEVEKYRAMELPDYVQHHASTEEEPSAIKEHSATKEPSAIKEPSATNQKPSATKKEPSVATLEAGESIQIKPFHEMEKEIIEKAIEQCDGNVVNAAKLLKINPSTLYRKIQNWTKNTP